MEEENKNELPKEETVQETTSQVDTPVVQPETPVVPTTEEKPVEQPNTPQTEETAKKGLLNNKKQVTGKKLSVWVVVMILIFMLFTFGLGVYFGKEVFSDKKKSNKGTNTEQTTNSETNTVIDNNNNENTNTVVDNNNNENTNTVEDNNNNEIIDIDVNDTEVKKLFDIFRYDEERCYFLNGDLNTNNVARLRLAYDSLPNSYIKTTSCSDYTPVLKSNNGIYGEYCGEIMTNEMSNYYSDNDRDNFEKAASKNVTKKILESDFMNHYNSIFSSSYQFNPEDFGYGAGYEPGCQTLKYYKDKKEFVMYGGQCGGTCGSSSQSITKAYKQGKNLYIETVFTGESGYKNNIKYEFILEGNSYKFVKETETK